MICSLSISVEINYHLLTLKVPNELINDVTKLLQIGGGDRQRQTATRKLNLQSPTDTVQTSIKFKFKFNLVWFHLITFYNKNR